MFMAFKINVAHKGKTAKFESENEELTGSIIGETIKGNLVSADLEGYELKITGTSDKAGFPGLLKEKGPSLKRIILKKGIGMKDNREGVRMRKTIRGNEISADTVQINTIVAKEGAKKFDSFIVTKEEKK
jgi:small subunit ribosomal protein S6e